MKNSLIVENTITGEKIHKSLPVDAEVIFDGGVMITETDLKGIITYANQKFIEMSGFTKEELTGAPHSINRHPDMPKGAFRGMWKTITAKKIWHGYIKNMRKDGKYYWVMVYVQPKYDAMNRITGYVAGRKVVNRKAIEEIEQRYIELHDDEYIDHKFFMGGELIP
jgi:PAS domain S-box-containing protein